MSRVVHSSTALSALEADLDHLAQVGLYRSCRVVQSDQSARVILEGREVIMLSSNNYLGLATHPRLRAAAVEAAERYGAGSGGSRLISGSMELHEQLEQAIARFKDSEAAIVFNSGYQANVGVISTLAGKGDIVFSDELNHASIIDGCRLSRAQVCVYPHRDVGALSKLLAENADAGRKLIVTDGVFSMDGDIAPLPDIVAAARRHGAMVMVDDAHATGVLGPNGRGTVGAFGLEDEVDIQMGTLSKALGGFGAFVAGRQILRDYLINRCRSFIFSTSLPPSVIASALAALEIVDQEPWRRERALSNAAWLAKGLNELGFDTLGTTTQIIPVVVGQADMAVRMSQMLLDRGVFAQGVRPPTVPEGKSRLRATVMATHTGEDLAQVLHAFAEVGRILGVV
ncbi:MAG: 8-amino-7-oxononanoate synthase [Actinobacteria bacterium]|nr:8-amino-7-oxononanoate synthase [Actinomycetota bacterium]